MAKRQEDLNKSLVLACDIIQEELKSFVRQTSKVEKVSGYKVGFGLIFGIDGLAACVDMIKLESSRPVKVIYDHQKAGTDIPDMGLKFADGLADAGVDAVILFPFAGPATQQSWTQACQDCGLEVIIGAEMTHPEFLHSDGGYISDDAPGRIFKLAVEMGVTRFVVPGNKPQKVGYYRNYIANMMRSDQFSLYSPGFITQSGDLSAAAEVAGKYFHPIIGRAIYESTDPELATREIVATLQNA